MDPVFKLPSVVPQDLLIIQDFVGPVVDNNPKAAPVKASPPSDDTSIESSEEETASEDEVDDLLAPGSPKPCGLSGYTCLSSQPDTLVLSFIANGFQTLHPTRTRTQTATLEMTPNLLEHRTKFPTWMRTTMKSQVDPHLMPSFALRTSSPTTISIFPKYPKSVLTSPWQK